LSTDYAALKARMSWMWSLGDYTRLAVLLEPHAESLAAACALRPGVAVLDVAAGNGNFAIAAARSGADVTASDLTPNMVELGRKRSEAAGLPITWVDGDAEDLPFPDSSFDVAASVFGAMFAPRPERVTAELFRVVRPGGLVAMVNYGPQGFLGRLAGVLSSLSAPSAVDLPSPFLWGDEREVRRRFERASSVQTTARTLRFEFESYESWLAFWEATNGPQAAIKTLLPPAAYEHLLQAMARLAAELNQASDGRLVLDSSCLQVLARR
jgi:ubiquinone/menaquinone biosynthesis C-methylase UbiE